MRTRGKFIVIEGVGGSGKSVQSKLLVDYLNSQGKKTVLTREPGGIPEAEKIRELIFKLKEKNLANSDHQLALFSAARYIWKENVVAKNIDAGINVVSDRTYFSTGAYQGYGEGGDLGLIEKISEVVMQGYKPDCVVLLDVTPEIAMGRNSKNRDGDPFDAENRTYFAKIINGYRKMAKKAWGGVEWFVVDGNASVERVAEDVRKIARDVVSL